MDLARELVGSGALALEGGSVLSSLVRNALANFPGCRPRGAADEKR